MSAIYENIALAAHKAKKKCGKAENITKRVFSIAEKSSTLSWWHVFSPSILPPGPLRCC